MAKDKRMPMGSNMNDIDMNDGKAMTDQEREKLQMTMSDADKKIAKRKKSM